MGGREGLVDTAVKTAETGTATICDVCCAGCPFFALCCVVLWCTVLNLTSLLSLFCISLHPLQLISFFSRSHQLLSLTLSLTLSLSLCLSLCLSPSLPLRVCGAGYMARRLMKALEDLSMQYDTTVSTYVYLSWCTCTCIPLVCVT